MSIIVKDLKIKGDKGEAKVKTLFDSGASISLIRSDLAQKIASPVRLPRKYKFTLGDGKGEIKAEWEVVVDLELAGLHVPQTVFIVDDLAEEFILGVDALQLWKIKLDFEKEDIIIDKKALQLRLLSIS